MIPETVYKYCREDISLIENYDKALTDKEIWDCHHRLGVIIKTEKLKEMGLYNKRPACELIFMKHDEHIKWHSQFLSDEKRENRSNAAKKRYESQTAREITSNAAKKAWESPETHLKASLAQKGIPKKKFKWKTPDGEIKMMDKSKAARWHPDWTLIE